jgi:hypothetical protein
MAGFPNRGGGTNPLPEWYTSMSPEELHGLTFKQLRRLAAVEGISARPTSSDQVEALVAAEKRWAREAGAATREAEARWFREARADRDLAWGVSPMPDAPEEGLRGPLGLRLRLWWMRQWLPGRTWKCRNRRLLCAVILTTLINGGIGLVNGNPWWLTLLIIVGTALATMTITRSWRADRDGD